MKIYVYRNLQDDIPAFLRSQNIKKTEIACYNRLLKSDISQLREDSISSSGYVIHTLEASIWCLLTTDCYEQAVLKAVNLGEDTDTTGTVTGGLAGLLYGYEKIPERWIAQLAKKADIESLAGRMSKN